MPFTGLMKTTSIPDTYAEIVSFLFDMENKWFRFTLRIWKDITKAELLNSLDYTVNESDPLWATYFKVFIPKNDFTDAIDDYLETQEEFEDSQKKIFPTVSFTATPLTGAAPLTVDFDGTDSDDPDGTIAIYSWVFQDENGIHAIPDGTATESWTFGTAGTFTAKLLVTDNDGLEAEASVKIVVT